MVGMAAYFTAIVRAPLTGILLITEMTGSYESLFSRRALKYKQWKLKDKKLSEKDYSQYILDEYTFLKRPVVIMGDKISVGSEKKTVEALKSAVK